MPEMPVGKTEETCFRTAAEIEAARLAAKKK
jgi:hypothetical protein